MPKTETIDRKESLLFGMSIDEIVKEDDVVRFLYDFVSSEDLKALGFKNTKTETREGRPAKSMEVKLTLLLYGYMIKVRSFRDLERLSKRDIGGLWITGMKGIDHNTLWKFVKNNRDALEKLLAKSVLLAIRLDMVDYAIQALDGTKITADASSQSDVWKNELEFLIETIEEPAKKSAETYMKSLIDEKEKGGKEPPSIPRKLKGRKMRDKIKNALDTMNDKEKARILNRAKSVHELMEKRGVEVINETDTDSRIMKNREGKRLGYNCQVVREARSGIIVAADVTDSASDQKQFVGMASQAYRNIGIDENKGGYDKTKGPLILADAGYLSMDQLGKAANKHINFLVNSTKQIRDKRKNAFHQINFKRDHKTDTLTCPKGGILRYIKDVKQWRPNQPGHTARVFKCEDYKTCSFRQQCSKSPRGRTVAISKYAEIYEDNLARGQTHEGMDLIKKRKTIVENFFGHIKHNQGFRRVSFRGLKAVSTQWKLICTTFNLSKTYQKWKNMTLSDRKSLIPALSG